MRKLRNRQKERNGDERGTGSLGENLPHPSERSRLFTASVRKVKLQSGKHLRRRGPEAQSGFGQSGSGKGRNAHTSMAARAAAAAAQASWHS